MTIKFLGHPVHMLLVHFPAALFPMDLVCSVLDFFFHKRLFADASLCAVTGGALTGWIALFFGLLDLLAIPEQKSRERLWGFIHGSLNGSAVFVFTLLAYLSVYNFPLPYGHPVLLIAIKAVTVCMLMVGNYFGGNLVLKYKIGVEE